MQIKIEKFLAFTAMLASAQLMNACVSEDSSSGDKGKEDSGLSTGHDDVDASHEGGPTEESGPTSEGPADETTSDGGPTDEGPTSEEGASDAGDASTEAPVDAGDEIGADASVDGGSVDGGPADEWVPDGSVEGDPTTEGDVDAGMCGPQSEGEISDNCTLFDACYEQADGGLNGQWASSVCYNAYANFRPMAADAFWDCYNVSAVADPCTEEADTVAQTCYDASIEDACIDENPDCATLAGICDEISVEQCNNATAPYNTYYLGAVSQCVLGAFASAAPDAGTEGCASIVYGCIGNPWAE